MKKLVLFFAVIVAVSFASCGNKAKAPAEEATADTTAVAADTTAAADTAAVAADTTAAPAVK